MDGVHIAGHAMAARSQMGNPCASASCARPPKLLGEIPTIKAAWQWSGEWRVTTDAVLNGGVAFAGGQAGRSSFCQRQFRSGDSIFPNEAEDLCDSPSEGRMQGDPPGGAGSEGFPQSLPLRSVLPSFRFPKSLPRNRSPNVNRLYGNAKWITGSFEPRGRSAITWLSGMKNFSAGQERVLPWAARSSSRATRGRDSWNSAGIAQSVALTDIGSPISRGWAAAGNPIKWTQAYVREELRQIEAKGDWSFSIRHEIGHNFDLELWNREANFTANLKIPEELSQVVEVLSRRIMEAHPYPRNF